MLKFSTFLLSLLIASFTNCLTVQNEDSTMVNITDKKHDETKFVYNGAKYKVNTDF